MDEPRETTNPDFAPCVRCGAETDTRIGGIFICESCYLIRSSCCPEFGADDLTAQENTRAASDLETSP